MSAGSCFASNLVPWLERAGIEYVRTETPHPALAALPENLGYRNFSAAYGNIYTARQFAQLLERATGRFAPVEDRWIEDGRWVDPFRPGLRQPADSAGEFEALRACHLEAVVAAVRAATVVVFTLGLTEAWASMEDGAVFPVAPGAVAGSYDPARHAFVNFSYDDVVGDLRRIRDLLDDIGSCPRLVLTVSPVPLVATATEEHVLVATAYSKAVLRAAAGAAATELRNVEYFPAYEIVTGPQAPAGYFDADARTVTPQAIEAVMAFMLGRSVEQSRRSAVDAGASRFDDASGGSVVSAAPGESPSQRLSRYISEVECEEAALDSGA